MSKTGLLIREDQHGQSPAAYSEVFDRSHSPVSFSPIQKKENKTGLPDQLKSGIEQLSGYSLDDVKVHFNSNKPAQLNAHAYAQVTDIHVAPGQNRHLPHEAWHVVQQKQGRVQPTMQMPGGVKVNDDKSLEKEADFMGAKALSTGTHPVNSFQTIQNYNSNASSVQQFKTVVQLGSDPIDEREGIPFKYGLIKGTYRPADNTADMHVEHKSADVAFSPVDVYKAFTFVYGKMESTRRRTDVNGTLMWNPQGAAVIKMVAELIGEALGDPELVGLARELKRERKAGPPPATSRDEDVISPDIVPEHLQYLGAARGAEGIDMQTVIPGKNTAKNIESNMLENSERGRARFQNYAEAMTESLPVSLRIRISQAQLGKLIETMGRL
ncbi:DUF4157 domain-containing protein [Gracilimonas mengyeensis]|uniref:eCIS core domain-containing protein n=1 Tax=Gracilimonas mengyeensis TaxID=1302730 RepID=A0A521AXK5_9BACT|nr:DUF4157 domain-containing protein [Gracilimonas mengyeensis]SMO39546.1 protein of unknown function [Gracilimonas mengyeensis]